MPLLPNDLRFDGRAEMLGRVLYYFTELDVNAASYGATFVLTEEAILANSPAIIERREAKRVEFERAQKEAA